MSRWLALAIAISACSSPEPSTPSQQGATTSPPKTAPRTLTIIGTNDLHGQIARLPMFAGYVANVRAERAADGGAVLLIDAGDLFQGTLESNLAEGADVVRAYNALGYAATAVGNHEFDYGPVGPAVTAGSGEDPRGALEARAAEAKFPFLVANIGDRKTGLRIDFPNMPASTLIDVAGAKVGIIGLSTSSTPTTTMPANFAGLRMMPTALTLAVEADKLRKKGATIVIATMHVGSECTDVTAHDSDATCDHNTELYKVLKDVAPNTVDAIVAGHTHAGIAQRIHDIPVIESYSQARAFGRIDLTVDNGHVTAAKIFEPQLICPLDERKNPVAVADCHPAPYDGKPVVADPAIQKISDDALARAASKRDDKLGVTLAATVTKAYREESPEGDLFTELMLAAQPTADVAMTNGGGLRTDLPAGELTYGAFFEAMPFDNRFAVVDVTGDQLRELVRHNLRSSAGIMSWGGLDATATCTPDGKLALAITVKGKPLDDKHTYKLVTSDFLTSGGDKALERLKLPATAIHATDVVIRDAMADALRARKGTPLATIDPAKIMAGKHLHYDGKRPVRCKADRAEDE
jgi:5'-nucleotidase|nr:bifunctional UDP-sugar hydrolase/5'-nucleotidase [Kofleriaceae bacterium]